MIEHLYLACMFLVTSPFDWHHALTLTFDLIQGQICCSTGDHNSPKLLVPLFTNFNIFTSPLFLLARLHVHVRYMIMHLSILNTTIFFVRNWEIDSRLLYDLYRNGNLRSIQIFDIRLQRTQFCKGALKKYAEGFYTPIQVQTRDYH